MYLKRKLNNELTIFKSLLFCYKTKQKTSFRHKVTIGIGGNIGDVKRRFEHLFYFLKKEIQVEVLQTSSMLKNPPFGYLNQNDFFNALIVVKTNLQPRQMLDYLLRIEKIFLRKRSFENAPRSLDLDIIFFDERVIKTPKLQIPHTSWRERESVVIPLLELNK